jgi:hypothetical protein
MTNERKLDILAKRLVDLYRENIRARAQLKALETMVHQKVPKNRQPDWNAEMKKLTQKFLQELLEDYEKHDPGFAAWIDDRKLDSVDLE